jgi:hypothetical protein
LELNKSYLALVQKNHIMKHFFTTFALTLFIILSSQIVFSQETIFEPVIKTNYRFKNFLKIVEVDSTNYPFVKVNGGGGFSGNFSLLKE